MTVNPAYPPVRPTPENMPMLEAWQTRGELLLQRCGDCGAMIYYPRAICPHCWSGALGWHRSAGRGTILSFSLVHRGLPDAFMAEVPIVLAEIELAEGVHLIARVVHPAPETVAIGDAVAVLGPDKAVTFPLPTFGPEPRP